MQNEEEEERNEKF